MQTARSILPELVSGRGTTRRVVEGQASRSFSQNRTKHHVHVLQNLRSRNSKGLDPGSSQPFVSSVIPPWPIAERMRFSIHFDAQPRVAAEEIQDIWPGRMLAAEFQSARTLTKPLPEDDFRKRHFSAELART